MKLVTFAHRPGHFPGVEVSILGCRVHHGLIGLILVIHDWEDRKRWLRDLLPQR